MSTIGFKPWDVCIDGEQYRVRIEQFDRGTTYYDVAKINDLDAEFVSFHSNMFVCWGIKYEPTNIFGDDILGNRDVQLVEKITITRNGVDFYSFIGDINTGIDKARIIISELKSHYFKFDERNYVRNIIGCEVTYNGMEYKVKKWFQNDLEVEIEQISSNKVKRVSIFDKKAIWGYIKKEIENKPCFVYYILNEARNKVKIGISNNPVLRAKNIQTSSGEEIEILNTIEFDKREDAIVAEDFLHKKFDGYRMKPTKVSTSSEWFDIKIVDDLLSNFNTKEKIMDFIQVFYD